MRVYVPTFRVVGTKQSERMYRYTILVQSKTNSIKANTYALHKESFKLFLNTKNAFRNIFHDWLYRTANSI